MLIHHPPRPPCSHTHPVHTHTHKHTHKREDRSVLTCGVNAHAGVGDVSGDTEVRNPQVLYLTVVERWLNGLIKWTACTQPTLHCHKPHILFIFLQQTQQYKCQCCTINTAVYCINRYVSDTETNINILQSWKTVTGYHLNTCSKWS